MKAKAQSTPTDAPALVVFGRDASGKAHGSAFNASDAELAAKAAELMGMRSLPIRTEVEQTLAAKLPRGRVFASGRAFVPFIKATLLGELQAATLTSGMPPLKVVGGADASAAGKANDPAPAKLSKTKGTAQVKQPCGWGDIQVGAIVLAAASPKYHEWHECLVLAVEGEDLFTLRYCDWPKEPPFARRRGDVALLHPAYTPEPPLDPEEPLTAA